MTLSIAWIHSTSSAEQLIFATDSRLRGGYAWDACPKILTLPRSDCAICFAGETANAYPLMIQMQAAISSYPQSRNRAMDVNQLKTYTLKIFNGMRHHMHDFPVGEEDAGNPNVLFILGGYSWKQEKFLAWKLKFNSRKGKFEYSSMLKRTKSKVAVIGDYVVEFKKRLNQLKSKRGLRKYPKWNMEPFEVLRDMLREDQGLKKGRAFPHIGGAPQVVKIHKHMNATPLSVLWPDVSGKIKVNNLGRPLMGYENSDWWVLHPDTLRIVHPYYSQMGLNDFVDQQIKPDSDS